MADTIPFFAVQREYEAHAAEFSSIFQATMATGKILQGPEVLELEKSLCRLIGRQHAIAINSCTDALYFSLVALGIKPGDEILVTDFSFVASASCIVRAGAVPIFVDIGPDYNMDFEKAKRLITKKTKALILVHLYGQMVDPSIAKRFCEENKLLLLEDSAQAIGAKWDQTSAGSLGNVSCISFDPTKPISSPGSGGCALTDDTELAARLRRLRYHGKSETKAEFIELGFNSQMPTFAAGLIGRKLTYVSKWTERRIEIAKLYGKGLAGLPVRVPSEQKPNSHIYHKYVIWADQRDRLQDFLKKAGIETMIHYQQPLHRQPLFSQFHPSDENAPNAIKASVSVLSLPIHPFLSNDEVQTVIDKTRQFYASCAA